MSYCNRAKHFSFIQQFMYKILSLMLRGGFVLLFRRGFRFCALLRVLLLPFIRPGGEVVRDELCLGKLLWRDEVEGVKRILGNRFRAELLGTFADILLQVCIKRNLLCKWRAWENEWMSVQWRYSAISVLSVFCVIFGECCCRSVCK